MIKSPQKFDEVLSRKELVFLHIEKTGMSSFWHGLANHLSTHHHERFSVRDAFHECLSNGLSTDDSLHALEKIFHEHVLSRVPRLVVHYHTPIGNIQAILPNAGIVIFYRNPADRLQSAFRHWKQHNPMSENTEFFSSYSCMGVNEYICRTLKYWANPYELPVDYIIKNLHDNVLFINFDDYVNDNPIMARIYKSLSIKRVDRIHFQGTITQQSFNQAFTSLIENDSYFAHRYRHILSHEIAWHHALNIA